MRLLSRPPGRDTYNSEATSLICLSVDTDSLPNRLKAELQTNTMFVFHYRFRTGVRLKSDRLIRSS